MNPHILIFSPDYFPYVGGAEIAVRELCERLPEFDFTLITSRNDRHLPREELIGRVRVIRVGFGIRRIDRYVMTLPAFWAACVIHRVRPCALAWGIMANAASFAAMLFARLHAGVPYLLTVQEGDAELMYARYFRFFPQLYRLLYVRADHVHVISRYLERWVRRMGYSGKISLIPNGVDARFFAAGASHPSASEMPWNIVTACRLVPVKGVADLLSAIALLRHDRGRDVRLAIAGDGPLRGDLERQACRLDIGDIVSFLGHCEHDRLPRVLAAADIFVLPSLFEGLGNSFLEAMAAGIPIVGTPVGGIPDFLIDGRTGLFCRTGIPDSIADAIERLMTDPLLRLTVVAGARAAIAETYDWDVVVPAVRRMIASSVQ